MIKTYKKKGIRLTSGSGLKICSRRKKRQKKVEQKNIALISELKEIIDNEEIRNRIIQEYCKIYIECKDYSVKYIDYKEYNICDVKKALQMINFNRGRLCTLNHLYNKALSIVFLKDKNVILFNSLVPDFFVYCFPDGIGTKMEIKAKEIIENKGEFQYMDESTITKQNDSLQTNIYKPIISYFPFYFLKTFLKEFYSRYLERNSVGDEIKQIPNFLI